MRGAAIYPFLRLSLLFCGCLAGCVSLESPRPLLPQPPNPFLEAIFTQEAEDKAEASRKKTVQPPLDPKLILREIPPLTPLAEARVYMERQGFSCWDHVQDNYRTCLWCTAYRFKNTTAVADRVTIELFYEQQRVVDASIQVEYGVHRGFWGTF